MPALAAFVANGHFGYILPEIDPVDDLASIVDGSRTPAAVGWRHWCSQNTHHLATMQISVYDTYVQRPDGLRMHFDILVPSTLIDHEQVLQYGRRYLAAKGLAASDLKAEKCSFCHMQSASPAVEAEIASIWFAILELENCG